MAGQFEISSRANALNQALGRGIVSGMKEPKRTLIGNVLMAVGAVILIPANIVARVMHSPIGYYAAGLALVGTVIAIIGAYIGNGR